MKDSERHSAAIILLDCMIDFAEQLSVNGGPTAHATADRIVRICKKQQQAQLRLYDASIAKEKP